MFVDKAFKSSADFDVYFFLQELKMLREISRDAIDLAKVKADEASKYYTEVINGKVGGVADITDVSDKAYRSLVKYKLHFNYIVCHSLFTTAFSLFEVFLTKVGAFLEKGSKARIKLSDISKKGGDLDKVRRYLDLVHMLNSARSDNETWQKLAFFNKVRNLILHNGNSLKKDEVIDMQTKKFLEKRNVSVDKKEVFRIDQPDFLDEFILLATEYMKSLLDEIYSPNGPASKFTEFQSPIYLDKALED
jgi:hypothetical protein